MSSSRQSNSAYFYTFVALMLLLALTVEAARHDLGQWNFAVATLIATCKAVLIMLCFMQVWRSIEITKLVVCAGFFWLAILFTLTLADYWTRSWLADDQQLSYDEPVKPPPTIANRWHCSVNTRSRS